MSSFKSVLSILTLSVIVSIVYAQQTPNISFSNTLEQLQQRAQEWRKQAEDWGRQAAENAQSFAQRFMNGSSFRPSVGFTNFGFSTNNKPEDAAKETQSEEPPAET
ncbi:uncharacterized protein [Euwallacea similis]|uniref:uncharacterized protein n=1 Tax=Euwallacea similis TaxID=1736056 RepID=UPI00344F94A4